MRLTLLNVSFSYRGGAPVLRNIDLTVEAGDSIAISGPSGVGKTTLLALIGMLARPVDGTISLGPSESLANERDRIRQRARTFGWVFQTVNTLNQRTAVENVALSLLPHGYRAREAEALAKSKLEAVGLGAKVDELVARLSGGERQRVCVARALAVNPSFVLADEPTGQLDHVTSSRVLDAIWEARSDRTALIFATHDPAITERCERVLHLEDGRLVDVA